MKGELLTRKATRWFEMDLDANWRTGERPPNEPSATASDDPSRIGPSGPGSHASLCSLPLIVEDLVPWENSIALALLEWP